MREAPSEELIHLLSRLGLATETQILAVRSAARRLARDLPLFDSVWVDALARKGRLTPLQAEWINAGRGPQLRLGPYLLASVERQLGYATWYRARAVEGPDEVRLAICPADQVTSEEAAQRLRTAAEISKRAKHPGLTPIGETGTSQGRIWAATCASGGEPADVYLVRNGRFPPQAVLEIACQMTSSLAELEQHGGLHGDLSAATLLVGADGRIGLPFPGLRLAVRPSEGYAHADLPPELYDSLAPERVAGVTAPTAQSELFACGCLWWRLLTGRAPLPGGNALAKLKAIHAAKIPDVRRLAPETPDSLAMAIRTCTEIDPRRRPESFARLATSLAPPTQVGQTALARAMSRSAPLPARLGSVATGVRRSRHMPVAMSAAVGCLLMAGVVSWPLWKESAHSAVGGLRAYWTAAPTGQEPPTAPAQANEAAFAQATQTVMRATSKAPGPAQSNLAQSNPAATLAATQTDREGTIRQASAADSGAIGVGRSSGVSEIVLPTGAVVAGELLQIEPGQTVRAKEGRATILVPATGLVVAADGVRFIGVDFVSASGTAANDPTALGAPLVECRGNDIGFLTCRFAMDIGVGGAGRRAAIAWTREQDVGRLDQLPSLNTMRLEDCVFQGVAAAVEVGAAGPVSLEWTNSLFVETGPVVRLRRFPTIEEPVAISLAGCTLRESGALIEAALIEAALSAEPSTPGKLSVDVVDCVLSPRAAAPVVAFRGALPGAPVLDAIEWLGRGSLLPTETDFAQWSSQQSAAERVDDANIRIDGLARSQLTFAGEDLADPASSRIARWSAPLQGDNPPGIQAERLAQPAQGLAAR